MAIELNAVIRTDLGKGASRRLRRAEQTPAVVAKERAEREPWTVVPDDMVDQWAEGRDDLN